MSQLATFYTLPKNQSDALLTSAVPETKIVERKGLIFKKMQEEQIDHFWDFLSEHASEQQKYQYSGSGFCDLDLALEGKGFMLFDSGIIDFSQKISEARATSIAVFDYSAATVALEKLNEVKLTESEIRKYILDNYSSEDEDTGINAISAALEIIKNWLKSVGNNEIGLLIVG